MSPRATAGRSGVGGGGGEGGTVSGEVCQLKKGGCEAGPHARPLSVKPPRPATHDALRRGGAAQGLASRRRGMHPCPTSQAPIPCPSPPGTRLQVWRAGAQADELHALAHQPGGDLQQQVGALLEVEAADERLLREGGGRQARLRCGQGEGARARGPMFRSDASPLQDAAHLQQPPSDQREKKHVYALPAPPPRTSRGTSGSTGSPSSRWSAALLAALPALKSAAEYFFSM